jgi:plastocyanin
MGTIRTTLTAIATTAALTVLAACGGAEDDPAGSEPTSSEPPETSESAEPSESPSATPSEEPREEAPDAPARAMIQIEDFAFSDPGPVAAGAKVTVENVDDVTHTVTADDGAFDVSIGPGETATFTAPSEAGDYGYFCEPHPGMTATLVVQ